MTLVLLSFLLLQLFQCSLRFLSGLRPVGRPGAKGFAKLRRIFLPCKLFKTFFSFCRLSAIFLRFIPKNISCFQSLRRHSFQSFPGSRRSPSGVRFSKASAKVDIPRIPSKYFRNYFTLKAR